MNIDRRRHRRGRIPALITSVVSSAVLVIALALAFSPQAAADTSPPSGLPATVSADPLPTVQIDGVAWGEVVVGNTVYVTGSFANARPAGTPASSPSRVARANLLAYDITTGTLITAFNHPLNGQGRAITASPDGRTLYVAGDFTTVDGVTHNRIASFSITTAAGVLDAGFTASLNGSARTVTASNTAVYVGGSFTSANGNGRNRLAAYSSASALLGWNPGANALVSAMTLAPDGMRVVVGGGFTTLAGQTRLGIGAVLTTGAGAPWSDSFPIKDYGSSSNITSLSADGTNVYGTGYYYTSGGNFEGRFAANPTTGEIVWMNSCHGDSYDAVPIGNVLYSAGHQHDCSDMGSFSQDDPGVFDSTHHFLAAETTFATGTLRAPIFTGGNGQPGPRYFDFSGQPSGTQLQWDPGLTAGTYTGQSQAAWTVAGNAGYLAVGGEFPTANGTAQQGLVRYAIRSAAPNRIGPTAVTAPTAVSQRADTLRVSWRAAADQDNSDLTYELLRDGGTTPITTVTYSGSFWQRPMLGFTDTSVAAGSTHTYRIRVSDLLGNSVTSAASAAATVGSAAVPSYTEMVRADGATDLWRLSETGGSTAVDSAGFADMTTRAAVTFGAAGPIPGQGTAASFTGAVISTPGPTPPPGFPPFPPTITSDSVAATAGDAIPLSSYTLEAWVRTTSTSGGAVLSDSLYTPTPDGRQSPTMDRLLYFANDGTVHFGMFSNNANQSIGSTTPYNDGTWHLLTATAGPSGALLYVDGAQVAANAALRDGAVFFGHWRLGGDSFLGWPNPPTSGYLAGSIANVAVYPSVLSTPKIQAHFQAAGGTVNVPPTATFTSNCATSGCTFNAAGSQDSDGTIAGYAWDFGDGATGSGQTPAHTYAAGTYRVTLTVTDNGGASGTFSASVTVPTSPTNTPPTAAFTSNCTDLACTFTGTGSSDPDGTIAGYTWDFGDGGTATAASPAHSYSTAGTYTVTLTVTDNGGATGTDTHTVSPTSPVGGLFANDTFNRTVTAGLGTADTGGPWTVSSASRFSTSGGVGSISLATPGSGTNAYLGGTSVTSADVAVTLALDKRPTASAYLDVVGRRVGTNQEYAGLVTLTSTGGVLATLRKLDGSATAVNLTTPATVSGLSYTAGTQLNARLQVQGTSPTTLRLKVWANGSAEPTAWAATMTDSSAGLQFAGSVGLRSYLSGSATNPPVVQTVRAFSAKPVG